LFDSKPCPSSWEHSSRGSCTLGRPSARRYRLTRGVPTRARTARSGSPITEPSPCPPSVLRYVLSSISPPSIDFKVSLWYILSRYIPGGKSWTFVGSNEDSSSQPAEQRSSRLRGGGSVARPIPVGATASTRPRRPAPARTTKKPTKRASTSTRCCWS